MTIVVSGRTVAEYLAWERYSVC